MLTPIWVQTLSDWRPVIETATLITLLKYGWDTARIKSASINQSESAHQPLLVLDHELRNAKDQIVDQSNDPTPATELAERLAIRNIGAGPAHGIVCNFEGVDSIGAWRSSIPYLKSGQGIEPAISKSFITRGEIHFEATYRSLARVHFQSRQALSGGVLGSFTMRKFGVFGQSSALLNRIRLAIRTRIKDYRRRKRVAALYQE